MSNLIKSGFVAFSESNTVVIDANDNKIIKGIDETIREAEEAELSAVEDALVEEMIRDAQLDEQEEGEFADVSRTEQGKAPTPNPESLLADAKAEASAILDRAHGEAEQLRATAYEEAESVKETAQKEGYQEGYRKATEAAKTEIAAREQELENRKQQMETDFREQQDVFVSEMEHKMVDWLCEMMPKLTGVMIDDYRDVLFYMANAALKDLDDCRQFVIRVPQEAYPVLLKRESELYGSANPGIAMDIFADAGLSGQNCLIETENGIVKVSLDAQLTALQKALRLLVKD